MFHVFLNIKKVCFVYFQKDKKHAKIGWSRNDFLFFLCYPTKNAPELSLLYY